MKNKVLIVEDDAHIRLGLEEILTGDGWEVRSCDHGSQALAAAHDFQPGLILLDIMLPGLSGYEICQQLRGAKVLTPILMLTAKSQEIDKVVGLELGADDYVTKPFGVRELLARIHALMRRARPALPEAGAADTFQIGAAQIDPRKYQVQRGSEVFELTAKELKLLQLLHQHPGVVFSRDQLLNEVWGYRYFGTTRTLDQTIVQLRKKLGDPAAAPKHLQTVHGIGYRLAP